MQLTGNFLLEELTASSDRRSLGNRQQPAGHSHAVSAGLKASQQSESGSHPQPGAPKEVFRDFGQWSALRIRPGRGG